MENQSSFTDHALNNLAAMAIAVLDLNKAQLNFTYASVIKTIKDERYSFDAIELGDVKDDDNVLLDPFSAAWLKLGSLITHNYEGKKLNGYETRYYFSWITALFGVQSQCGSFFYNFIKESLSQDDFLNKLYLIMLGVISENDQTVQDVPPSEYVPYFYKVTEQYTKKYRQTVLTVIEESPNGLQAVVRELQRQREVEGYGQEGDRQEAPLNFLKASMAYMATACDASNEEASKYWPGSWSKEAFKPSNSLRAADVVRSIALAIRYIDSIKESSSDDEGPTIPLLVDMAHKGAVSKGFYEAKKPDGEFDFNVGEKLALIHEEVSEALSAHRKDLNDDKLTHRKGLEVELGDAVLRICDLAGALNLDLVGAIIEKHNFNKTREYKHGKKF